MEKLLHLYKYVDGVNDSPFPSKEQQATLYEFKYDAKRMGNAPTITGTLMHPLCLDELWGNNEVYVSYNGERYFIKQTPTSSYSNDDTRYKHECDFVSERVLLNDVYFYDVVTSDVSNDKPVSNSSNVIFYGDIHELAKRLNYLLQYAKLEYSVVVDEGITSESKLVSFQKQFFANVLQEGYKLFEIPYYFEGKVIHFGYTNNTIDKLFSYGAKDALLSISKNNITQRIVNRITGVGSADNIPYYYPNFDPKGVSEVLYNGKVNNLVSVENLIKYKKVKLGDTFIYNYESDKVIEYVDKSKYVVSKDITLLSENYETTKRYELVLDFPFSVDIAPQSSIIELNYSKTFLTNFKARLYRNLELRDTFTSFGEIPYYRLIEGEYNFSIALEFTFGEFDEKTELTESDIPSIVDALTISITSDVSGFEQWTLNTANNIVKLNDYGLKLNTSPKNGDKITFKQLSYIPPQPNLMPPIYRETLGAERFYNALNNTYYDRIMGSYYSFDNLFIVGKNKEDDVLFEDIKPSIKGVTNSYYERIDVFSEFAWDENDNDEFDEEGNYLHPYFFGKLRLFDGEFGFNLFDHAIEEDEMVISMTSGSCGGCNFIIGVDNESQKNIVQVDENGNLKRDANGNVLYGSPQERQNDTSKYEVWVALKKDIETFGVIMPNATNNYRPSAGDTFVILHIDLPNAYILAAEERLREELVKYMKENNSEKFNFSLSFSRIFFAENPTILAQLNENARIKIAYNNNAYTLYVSSYSYSMNTDTALPEIRVELSEELAIVKESIIKQLENASLYLNKEVQRVNTSVATTNITISKNTTTAQASITKTNARVENVEKVVMNLQSNSGGGGGQGGINEEQLENYLTTNQYAKKSDIPSLDAYAKSEDIANTYATKSALKGVSDSVGTLRTDFDNLNALLNDDTSGVIDTWREVVDFIDEYSDSQDLATILAGMNEDISKRVLATDFDKANDSIKDLLSYFDASGSANNALKLGGHSADYFATANALNTHITAFNNYKTTTNERLGNLEALWYIDNDGNLHTIHNIVVDGGGAFGKGSGGGGDVPSGGGIDETQLWNILGQSGTQTIHSSHIPDLSGKYLPLSGGALQGSLTLGANDLIFKGSDTGDIAWYNQNNVEVARLYNNNGTLSLRHNAGTTYPLIHSGNIGSQSVSYASSAGTANNVFSGSVIDDANTVSYTDKALRWYSGISSTTSNIPTYTGYQNGVLALPLHSNGITAQWYFSYSKKPYYRSSQTSDWNEIAYVTDNVASATKLNDNTAFTAWGQTFFQNGVPKNANGPLYDVNGREFLYASGNLVRIGSGTAGAGQDTYLDGNNIYFRYGTSYGNGFILNASGNILMGTTTDNGYKLAVNGTFNATTIYQNGTAIGSLAFKNSLVASDIPNLSWSKITSGKPTTLGGYGITDALSTSGGTITGTLRLGNPDVLYNGANTTFFRNASSDVDYGTQIVNNWNGGSTRILLNSDGISYWDTYGNVYPLIHSGNIGSQSVANADTLDGLHASDFARSRGSDLLLTDVNHLGYGGQYNNWPYYGPAIVFGVPTYFARIQKEYGSNRLSVNSYVDGIGDTAWQSIAFLDDNVASATKLQTARTIWGQNFDGTGNVSGTLSGVNAIFFEPTKTYGIQRGSYYSGLLTVDDIAIFAKKTVLGEGGNVLIGTTSDSGYKLKVRGTTYLTFNTDDGAGIVINQEKTSAGYNAIRFATNGTTWGAIHAFDNGFGSVAWTYRNLNISSKIMTIGAWNNPAMTIYDETGNVIIGSTTDNGHRLQIAGAISLDNVVLANTSSALLVQTPSGASWFGMMNNSFCHIYTNAPAFYMNKQLYVDGNLTVTGGGAFGSDIRYKDIISYRQLDLETIANAPLFTFRWTDREDKEQHLGTSAQYWLETQAKDAVNITNPKFFHLDYGALGVGIGISVGREVKVVKTEVKVVKSEVEQLRKELAQVKQELNYYKELWQHSAQA